MTFDYEVVPESEYTIFEDDKQSKAIFVNAGLAVVGVSTTIYGMSKVKSATGHDIYTPIVEPIITHAPSIPPEYALNPEMMPVGFLGETSMTLLTNIMDPVIQLLVAISLPVASVIMIGACFLFMFGNSEKAWSTIMNAGLGFILIQLSPMFLEILKEIGKAL